MEQDESKSPEQILETGQAIFQCENTFEQPEQDLQSYQNEGFLTHPNTQVITDSESDTQLCKDIKPEFIPDKDHPRPFQCPVCPFRARLKSTMVLHYARHTEGTILQQLHDLRNETHKCSNCNKTFKQAHHLNCHTRRCVKFGNQGSPKMSGDTSSPPKLKVQTVTEMTITPQNISSLQMQNSEIEIIPDTKNVSEASSPEELTAGAEMMPDMRNFSDLTLTSKDFKNKLARRYLEDQPRPFECSLCPFRARLKSTFKIHMMKHTGERPYQCPKCPYQARQSSTLTTHMRIHTGEMPFKCKLCDAKFRFASGIIHHERQHYGERPYGCNICNFAGTQWGSATHHMRGHSQENTFKCSMCPYWSSRSNVISRHERSCHNHEPYQGKVYVKGNLTDGGESRSQITVSGQDDNSRRLQCLQCSFKTGRESTLRRHALKHAKSSETPINLENSTSLNKVRHIGGSKVHKKIPVKPYQCQSCSAQFLHKSSLSAHERKHTGELPYQCTICKYAGTYSADIRGHMRGHQVQKDFKCSLCNYWSFRQKIITKHEERCHGDGPYVSVSKIKTYETLDENNDMNPVTVSPGNIPLSNLTVSEEANEEWVSTEPLIADHVKSDHLSEDANAEWINQETQVLSEDGYSGGSSNVTEAAEPFAPEDIIEDSDAESAKNVAEAPEPLVSDNWSEDLIAEWIVSVAGVAEQPGSDNRSKDAIAETTGNVNEVAELPGPSGLTTNVTEVLEYAAQGDNLKKYANKKLKRTNANVNWMRKAVAVMSSKLLNQEMSDEWNWEFVRNNIIGMGNLTSSEVPHMEIDQETKPLPLQLETVIMKTDG